MKIKQRCPKCRALQDYNAQVCQRSNCGAPLPKVKLVYFQKKIKGKVHTHSAGQVSKAEADRLYQKWLSSLRSGPVPEVLEVPRLKKILDVYLDKLKVEGKAYGLKAKKFFERAETVLGEILTSELTVDMVKRFQTRLREAGASASYCDRHLAMLKAAWNYSLPDTPNPFSRVKLYRPDNTLIRFLTEDEEASLLEAARIGVPKAPKNLDVLVLVAIHTGLRKENILSLHTDQVDFRERKIKVRQKRDLTHEVPMNQTVYDALLRIKPKSAGYYFPSRRRHDDQPYTRFEGTWKTLKKAAGITRPFRFHDLRHSCATRMLKATGNLALVGKFLGHRNLSTTAKYAHILMDDLREAARLLETREKDNQKDNQAVEG